MLFTPTPLYSLRDRGVVMNGAKIGCGSLIGANKLIPEGKEIPEGVLVIGSPGKVVRDLRPEERENLLKTARGYVERSRLFKTELREQALPDSARFDRRGGDQCPDPSG